MRRRTRPCWPKFVWAALLAHWGCHSADPVVETDAPSVEEVVDPAILAPEAQQSGADSPSMGSVQSQSELATTFPLRLQWAFRDGDQFRWVYESRMELETPQDGEVARMSVQARLSFDASVSALDEGLFKLNYDLDRVEVTMDSPDGMSFDYDSDMTYPDVPSLAETADLSDQELLTRMVADKLSDVTELEIETSVNATGQIHKLEAAGTLEKLAELQGLETLLFLIDDEGLSSLHAGGFVRVPEYEIDSGIVWEQSTDVPIQYGIIRFTHTATPSGLEVVDAKDWLRFDTTIASANVEINPTLEERLNVEHSGGSGVLYIDPASGELRSYEFDAALGITLKGTTDSGSDQTANVAYSIKTMLQRVDPSSSDR